MIKNVYYKWEVVKNGQGEAAIILSQAEWETVTRKKRKQVRHDS